MWTSIYPKNFVPSVCYIQSVPIRVLEDANLIERLRVAYNGLAGPSGEIAYPELRDILNASFVKGEWAA